MAGVGWWREAVERCGGNKKCKRENPLETWGNMCLSFGKSQLMWKMTIHECYIEAIMICHDGFLCMAPISRSSSFLGLFRRSSCAKTLMLASSERPLPRLGPLFSLQTCNDTSTTACSDRMRGTPFTTEAVLLSNGESEPVKHQGVLYHTNGWLLMNAGGLLF